MCHRETHLHTRGCILVFFTFSRWFNNYEDDSKHDNKVSMKISFHDNLLGPTGNIGSSSQPNQVGFNTKQWMIENELTKLVGVIFYSDIYLEAIQFTAAKLDETNGRSCSGLLSFYYLR